MAEYLISELEVPEVGKTLIFKDKEARNDLSTAVVETSASNPLTFTTRSAQNAQSAEIVLEPIQDLHGYDHPWPEGGWKNKLNATEAQVNCTLSNGVYTLNSIPQTNQGFIMGYVTLTPGDYIINGGFSNDFRCFITVEGVSYTSTGNDKVFTITTSGKYAVEGVINTSAIINTQIKPMIRLATETDPTFAPYSNICPISGHTEVSLKGCGVNIYDKEHLYDGLYNSYGTLIFGSNYRHSMTPCKENQVYSLYRSNRVFGGYVAAFFTSDKVFISTIQGNTQYMQTFTTPLNAAFIAVQTSETDDTINEMLVEGTDIPTTYEPYTPSNDLTKDLGQEVFGASYNPVSGELVVTIAEVDLGDLEWSYYNNSYFRATVTNGKIVSAGQPNAISSVYEIYTGNGTNFAQTDKKIWVCPSNLAASISYVAVIDSAYTDATAFKTAMSGVQLCYELSTPITYHLTPDEIKLLSGVNTVWTDGTSIKVAYRDGKVATLADLESIEAVSSMDKLTDVELTDLADGQSLVYDGSLQKWVNSHLGYDAPVIYSEEEREIGVWTDGKPLYQKTFYCASLPNNSSIQISTGYTELNTVNLFGIATAVFSTGIQSIPLPSISLSNNNISLRTDQNGEYIIISTQSDRSLFFAYVTLQYTKTTDVPGSGKWTIQGATAHHYSTEEQVIGTWIDGKPLYEKTLSLTTPSDGDTNTNIYTITENMENVIDLSGFVYASSPSYKGPINHYITSDDYLSVWTLVDSNGIPAYIRCRVSFNRISSPIDVIIRYTKTTDTAQTQSNIETQTQTAETQTEQTEDI